jgi:NADP-dependent aldehyde dehydrogenase
MEGHLTATVHATDADLREFAGLLSILEERVGRIVYNGYPTGVEVCPSINHGGPVSATTDGKFTSVGTGAILRFVRPICYQNVPDARCRRSFATGTSARSGDWSTANSLRMTSR